MKEYSIIVVGATGAVGQEMVRLLELRNFPVKDLHLLASERSVERVIKYKDVSIPVEDLQNFNISNSLADLALFSAGAMISQEYAPKFVREGIYVIDNSSSWRMDPQVPLVVSEVNPHTLHSGSHLIANPNCSTIQMVVVLKPLHRSAKIKRIIVSTYQSVSGAGMKAMEDLRIQSEAYLLGRPIPEGKKFLYPIAFNCIPQIDIFLDNAYTKEEMKMVNETKKILEDETIRISATCIRVPVFRCHSESVYIETEKKLTPGDAREILSKAPGVEVLDDPVKQKYPLPRDAEEKYATYVGRIRQDLSSDNGLCMWIVSDNLWKGAALNAVQIAELLVEKRILTP